MLLEIILALVIGILAGTITGLTPGIHINLLGVLLVSLSASIFAKIPPIYLAVFIVAMSITHTFTDFIPSVFLGCPDSDTALSILPGHSLLKKGQGYEAVLLTVYGSAAAIILLLFIAWPSIKIMPSIYNSIQNLMPYILIGACILLITFEKKKLSAIFVLLFTGALGLCVLNLPSLNQPLLPLLSGLFGGSMLLISIKAKSKIPPQIINKPKAKFARPLLGALIASPLCSFLPGLGSSQAAIIGHRFARINPENKEQFLVLLGATNTLVMGFSFLALYAIAKTRTGSASAIQKILADFSPHILILIIAVILVAGGISFFTTSFLAKRFSEFVERINYTLLSSITLAILSIVVTLVSGFLGFIILVISTFTGLYCISLGTRRTSMMGCLLIPTILFYLFRI